MDQLVIQFDNKGNVNVTGPLHNKVLCMGLFEVAKHLILSGSNIVNDENGPKPSNIIPVSAEQVPPSPALIGKKR